MRPGIDPKVDYAFKRVFGSEETTDVLVSLLNAVLAPPPGAEVTAVELCNPFSEKDAADDKQLVLDVKARDANGRWFNVEMQMTASTSFPQRVLYYWADLYVGQLREGQDFDALRPTVSISFLNNRRFTDAAYHHRFRLRDDCGEVVLTDHLEIHLVELPKFTLTGEQLTTALEVWCYFLRHGGELDTEALPAALDVPPVRQALEVLSVMSLNDRERELYQARLKARRDHAALLKDVRDAQEALEAAREEAREAIDEAARETREAAREAREALGQGVLIGQIQFCQRRLGLAVASREALLALSASDLSRLAGELEQRAFAPG